MNALAHDIRYAVRQLLRTPAFTSAAIITLALGIGINTAFFAVVNAVVFRPMRALHLDGVYRVSFDSGRRSLTLDHYRLLEANMPDGVEAVDAQRFRDRDAIAHVPGRAERVFVKAVSGGHRQVFGVQPQAGRFISHEDDRGRVPSAVISDRLWREWFAADPGIVERGTIRIDNEPYHIVGVAPIGYGGSGAFGPGSVDIWVPLSREAPGDPRLAFTVVDAALRLRTGTEPEAVEASIKAVVAGADDAVHPMRRLARYPASLHAAGGRSPFRGLGLVVLSMSALVLLAACANLANLLYVRGVHRRAEMSVRQALGASTTRIFRMLVAEALVIGITATIIGLVLALVATRQFNAMFPMFRDRSLRLSIDLSPDYFVFLYALGAGAAAAIGVGAITAWRASRVPPMRGMAVGDAATSLTHASRRTRLGLVALQVGAAVVLLMTAGIFYQQTRGMLTGTVYFDTRDLATARIDLSRHGYNFQTGYAFLRRLNDEVARMPGLAGGVIADGLPGGSYMGGSGMTLAAERADRPFTRYIKPFHRRVDGRVVATYAGFADVLGLKMRQGRDLRPTDTDGSDLVVLVSEAMAADLWPGEDPLGRRLMFGNEGFWRTVVGVFEDASPRLPVNPARREFDPARLVVTPIEQRYPYDPIAVEELAKKAGTDPVKARQEREAARDRMLRPREMLIVVRAPDARGQLDAVKKKLAELDSNVALFDAATVDESILAVVAPRRAGRLLLGALGGAALVIATLGIYGVVSFFVARRKREFGIRMALGAQKRQVVKMVVDDAIHLMLVGLLVGVFLFAVAERGIQAREYGFMPNDIPTWAVVLLGILAIGLLAAFIPARRAAAIDPNIALRDL